MRPRVASLGPAVELVNTHEALVGAVVVECVTVTLPQEAVLEVDAGRDCE